MTVVDPGTESINKTLGVSDDRMIVLYEAMQNERRVSKDSCFHVLCKVSTICTTPQELGLLAFMMGKQCGIVCANPLHGLHDLIDTLKNLKDIEDDKKPSEN